MAFDAVLLVSFGGPEGPDEVEPFLENVLRGRQVPRERMEEVAAHYLELGGISPINGHNRDLLEALRTELAARPDGLPAYWGNRNWHPFLPEAVASMRADGVRRAAAFVTSAYSSYSSCRQYLEDLERARAEVGEDAPEIVKLRPYYNHPGFVEPLADGLRAARAEAGPGAPVLMSAHSIPMEMAAACDYEQQLRVTARLVAAEAGEAEDGWSMVYQSRSGPPTRPWLGPDVQEAIAALPGAPSAVIVVPIGFVSDHMEVIYDLDRMAARAAASRGARLVRSATPGSDPRFVAMICDLIDEADRGPASMPCHAGCCPAQASSAGRPAR